LFLPMKPLTHNRWRRIDDLLARALERPEAEREAFLDACGEDPELRAEVAAMLRAEAAAAALLDQSAATYAAPLIAAEETPIDRPPAGHRIGPYRILETIGAGGMGVVYRAERADGAFEKRVALKLVKRGMDTDEVLRRFRYERRILASLDHPHIATLYDGGVSADGRPYLVMELIEGEPITAYCDRHRLTVDRRLDLFRHVCVAVQHAHQKLVIHRDVKPSNILVTADGTPKLLDFGIAKLLLDEDENSPRTRAGVRLLTPDYAAPEQLRGDPVTTATDVFSLGAVLYQLVTGTQPFHRRAIDGTVAPADQVARRPSTAVSGGLATEGGSGEASAESPALERGTTPERLRRRLQGDLDTILLKCLDPDLDRRYSSPQQLIDDLDRHRLGLPVRARPDSWTYRARKFAGRYRVPLAAAGLAGALLAGQATFHTLRVTAERDRAQTEAVRAQTTARFLQRLLGDAYPSVTRGESFSMSELMRRAVARVDSLPEEPILQAALLRTLGDVYREQGEFVEARILLERAAELHRRADGLRSRAYADVLMALGHLYYDAQEFAAAAETHSESLDIFRALYLPDDTLVLFATNNLATAAAALGDHDRALALHQEVLARRHRLFADTSQLVHTTLNNIGDLFNRLENYEAAEREFREAVRIREIALPRDHPSLALTAMNLGTVLQRLRRHDEAEPMIRQALEIFERVFGPDHPRVGLASFQLATVLEETDRLEEAARLFAITTDIDRRIHGPDHPEVALDLRRLGIVNVRLGECPVAEEALAEADRILDLNAVPLDDKARAVVRDALVSCLLAERRFAEAEAILVESLEAGVTSEASIGGWTALSPGRRLAELYEARGNSADVP
jgi:eukaryotic-like serine/threonine-protein kinase